MRSARMREKPPRSSGPRNRRPIGPEDLEAHLYPLIQREAASRNPANFWEVGVSREDALALSPHLTARFTYDAIEHYAREDPRLGEGYLDHVLVAVEVDASIRPGSVRVRAHALSPAEVVSHRARAVVTNRGFATKGDLAPPSEPSLYTCGALHNHTEEGEAMGVKDFFSSLGVGGKVMPPAKGMSARWASPDDIIQNTLNEIDDKAMNWPDGKDLPDRVIVYLSQADYARYGPRKQASERHIEAKILDYAQECGALLERNPSVTIKVDPMLYAAQMRIDASFSEPAADEAGNACASTRKTSPVRQHAHPAHPARPSKPDPCTTPEYIPSSALRTPVLGRSDGSDCAIAKLANATFQSAVLPNDTVGRCRYNDRPRPTISLDGPDFEFVSQEQGVFEHDRDGWWLISTGRNGTSVQRKGAWTRLPEGQRFPLEDGDSISFAKCPPLVFSIAQ